MPTRNPSSFGGAGAPKVKKVDSSYIKQSPAIERPDRAARGSAVSLVPQEILSVAQERETDLSEVDARVQRLRELLVLSWNDVFGGYEKTKFQDEIDALLGEISALCRGLKQLDEHQAPADQSGVLDADRLADLRRKIDLGYLGLDKGINITRTYKSVAEPNREPLASAFQASSTIEGRQAAAERLAAFDAAMSKFPPAMDRYASGNLSRGLPPVPAWITYATQLADEVNKANPGNVAQGITSRDVVLLAGGEQNVASFLEQVKAVSPDSLNLHLVETATEKVRTELSLIRAVRNGLDVAMREKTVSGPNLAAAEERARAEAMKNQMTIQSLSVSHAAAFEMLRQTKEGSEAIARGDAAAVIQLLR